MRRKKHGAVEWLEFELLADIAGLTHAVFLRHGGASTGPFASLNTCVSVGDDPKHVAQNIEKIRAVIGVARLERAVEKHGIAHEFICADQLRELGVCDGLITVDREVGLVITHADCQAAIFYDPKHRAIANVHCGWRGNVQNIYGETIRIMREKIGSRPEELIVGISPSLGPAHAEFKNYRTELPDTFLPYQVQPTYFDLWEISRQQLLEAGIVASHIEIAGICTYAEARDFFSYRRDKPVTGRHATVVALTS